MFKLNIHDLTIGSCKEIEGNFDSLFLLDNDEKELVFKDPVQLKILAVKTEDDLILTFNGSTFAYMPCKICNAMTQVALNVSDVSFTIPLNEIKGAVFNYMEYVREAFLLELPLTIECNNNECPERKNLSKYLK
jgi:uncharacterized metal-binding protein YceD (DUF177 family)